MGKIEQRFVPEHNPDPTEAGADLGERLHQDGDAVRGGARLPGVPPVIETLYPSIDGLPPGVFEEWVGECFAHELDRRLVSGVAPGLDLLGKIYAPWSSLLRSWRCAPWE